MTGQRNGSVWKMLLCIHDNSVVVVLSIIVLISFVYLSLV